MILQKPSILAQLPHPFADGQIQCGTVHGLADSKKRKRYEISVAIDGESVNIYDIRSPRLLTSFVVPPQSTFTCPPCSTLIPTAKKARYTHFSLHSPPEAQLKCYVEEISRTSPKVTEFTRPLDDVENQIAFVDTLSVSQQEEPDVIVVYQDCEVQRLSANIQEQRWRASARQVINEILERGVGACETASVFLLSFEEARRGIFKAREDIVASLAGHRGRDTIDCSILVLVTTARKRSHTSSPDYRLHYLAIPHGRAHAGTRLHEDSKSLHCLASFPMPAINELAEGDKLRFTFHASSGTLTAAHKQGLLNIDLTKLSPAVASRFEVEAESFSSIARISGALAAGATSTAIKVFDTKFRAVQGRLPLDEAMPENSKKRKRAGAESAAHTFSFVTYFQTLKVLTAVQDGFLLAFDFRDSLRPSKDSLLVDSIGRGLKRDEATNEAADVEPTVVAVTPHAKSAAKEAESLKQLVGKTRSLAVDQALIDSVSKSAWISPNDIVYCLRRLVFDNSDNGEHPRRALVHLLRRLESHASGSVVSALRQEMPHLHMFALINFLRQQLFLGGYTSSFSSQTSASMTENNSVGGHKDEVLSLAAITGLLKSVIDAVGIAAWTGSPSGAGQEDGLIRDLRMEISLALSGVEEAAYLKGILRELLRYGQRSSEHEDPVMDTQAASVAEWPQKPGEIITIFDDRWDRGEEATWLPLDLRSSKEKVSPAKIRRGNGRGMKRSKREMRYLESKKVGRYSLDRLVW